LGWEGWAAEVQGDRSAARAHYQEAAKLAPTLAAAIADGTWGATFAFVYGSQGVMEKRAGRQRAACELFARADENYGADKQPDPYLGYPRAAEVERELAECRVQAASSDRLRVP